MLKESFGRSTTENHSGRDKQVPAVKDCRFTQTAFGTVVHEMCIRDRIILKKYSEGMMKEHSENGTFRI